MRPLHTSLLLLLATGCLPPEEGIDRTRVKGVLRVEAETVREGQDNNDQALNPVPLDPLAYGYRVHQGKIDEFEYDEATDQVLGDIDYWLVNSPVDRGVDETRGPLVFEVTLDEPAANARLWIKNIDELGGILGNEPLDVYDEDFTGSTVVELVAETDVNYVIGLGGMGSPSNRSDYTIVVLGQHPDEANLLVGAYSKGQAEDRGELLGGTNAKPFTETGDHAFESWYEMLFLRDFETDEEGDVVVLDEDVKKAFLWAGSWANLTQGLPAGTWYSEEPVQIDPDDTGAEETHGTPPDALLPEEEDQGGKKADEDEPDTVPLIRDVPTFPTVDVGTPLLVNAVAPAVIGQTFESTELNDTNIVNALQYGEAFDPLGAQDLGTLSGPGFVDQVVDGTMSDNGYGYWTGENDTYRFQVPEPTFLNFTLAWADPGHDLDIVLIDAEGNVLDQGYYGFPEIPEVATEVLQPGQDYFLAVLLWIGPGVDGAEVPYDLTLEQLAP